MSPIEGNSPAGQFRRIIVVPFDHLNRNAGALREAAPETDLVVMVESKRMLEGRPWHPERLWFLLSSARHFADEVRTAGFTVDYVQAESTPAGLAEIWERWGHLPTVSAQPSSFSQERQFRDLGIEFLPNDFFLTTRELFAQWAERQKTFVMENFYRAQRIRLGVLVDGTQPEGGRWNFDADNRLPPPKNYEWPAHIEHPHDEIDREVAQQLNFEPTSTWATTREGALTQLRYFVDNHLAGFGPYEDAMAGDDWSLHHSLLSPYLNVGLLQAREVIDAALAAFRADRAPIQSVEAFVRQIIGWREYINGMYWFLGEGYRELNGLEASRPLPPVFTDSSRTRMACVGSVIGQIEHRAWTHHIPRLMVLSNLALLSGTNPQEFLDWMRENFVDASEWVMVPNVIGMGVHADSGVLMTKPYAAGGPYIKRMGRFCGSCPYDPSKRVGDNACPFTTLYWDFLDRHRDAFARNHRMGQQLAGLNRLSDIDQIRERARWVLEGIDLGTV